MYTVDDITNAVNDDWDGSWNEFLECTDDEGGAELSSLGVFAESVDDGGERYPWVVFKIGDQYFEMNGSHDSWEGTSWDGGLQEVQPFKKTVTAYRPVK